MEYNCDCHICKNNRDFEMPNDIIDATLNNKLVIFAGAGVSTETKTVFPYSLYEDICYELDIDIENNLSFSKLMSLFCEKNSRKDLLIKIKKRIDYVFSFPQLYNFSSRFHRELSHIHYIEDIFTTNWDDLFERECGAIPIVTSEDFAFWDLPERKVFKIHGSINNIGTIVVTEKDYKKCLNNLSNNLIGNYLRMALATKTIIFIGYSFGDEDFNHIYELLSKELGEILPQAYLVTLDENAENKMQDKNIKPIITDGTYFIHKLKNILIKEGYLLNDKQFAKIPYLKNFIEDIHGDLAKEYNAIEFPNIIYTLSYQDGLIHALERIENRKKTGEYSNSCKVRQIIKSYDEIQKEKMENELYSDVAYIEGYINGLLLLFMEEEDIEVPLFFLYGYEKEDGEPISYDEYIEILESKEIYDQETYKYAEQIVKNKINDNPEMVIHHTPFL
ncbi:SIR2 family protein [Halocella sp. SP3-1]|uniref:SIR2 family protein n=1 Tax=Halocella sp. SP3-1 TaxID=2382161 RepID=UPI000F75D1B7|nr:SIR2 family protein [Halocella sp. SP3-1]AZO94951.1 hypothetical protein D7D81_10310 [Halocella sp. SP3-1]